jgi:gliding motility-associated-like protein
MVHNIHPDGTGFSIVGTAGRPTIRNNVFTNSFLLKVDSAGVITPGATGDCAYIPAVLTASSVTVSETYSGIDSVIDVRDFSIANSPVSKTDVPYYARLFCYQKMNCTTPVLSAGENGCSTGDTLVYYIAHNNCGALVTWKFDSAFFKLTSLAGDTLKLHPLKTGSSFIGATIENDCSIKTDSIMAAVSIHASSLDLGPDTAVCPGSSIKLKAGPGYDTYQWNNGSTDSIITVSSEGIYFVKVTDKCGAEAVDSITVHSIESTFHITGDSEKCNKDTVILSATAGFNHYQWSPSVNLISSGNAAKVNPVQTTKYYVTAETLAGCQVKDSFLLTVKTSPLIHLGNDTSLCYDKPVILTAPDGFKSYTWSNGSIAPSAEVFAPGVYSVKATWENNCFSTDTIEVKKYTFTPPYLGSDTAICSGTGFRLSAGSYAGYEWSNGENNPSVMVNSKGLYWVKITDQNNCVGSDTIEVLNVFNSPSNFLNHKIEICLGDVARLQPAPQFKDYKWSTGAVSSYISVNDPGRFWLTVTDENGCIGKDTILVAEKDDCPRNIYFFNAFTHNSDGKNEQFKPVIKGIMEKYVFQVYSRFGEMIFSTTNQSVGWNGTYKGEPQPVGSYVFICNYKFPGYTEEFKKGSFVLLR